MAHWGWYWWVKKKHISRKLCSELPSIDSFGLYKNNQVFRFTVQPVEVKGEACAGYIKVTYRDREAVSYVIGVDRLACNYGGSRYFFKCPLCQKRMRFLYLAERSIFLCRRCLNLGYHSQKLRPSARYNYMSEKIINYVKNKGGDLENGKKPLYMKKTKYRDFSNKQSDYEDKWQQAFAKELREWFGPKVEPYL